MKRFSTAYEYFNRVAQSEVDPQSGKPWGQQFDPTQRPRMIRWPEDDRFMYDPVSKTIFFDELPISIDDVHRMQQEWAQEGESTQEAQQLATKLGIPKSKTPMEDVVRMIFLRWYEALPEGPKNDEQIKNESMAHVKDVLTKENASGNFINSAMFYLNSIFDLLRVVNRPLPKNKTPKRYESNKKIAASEIEFYRKLVASLKEGKKIKAQYDVSPSFPNIKPGTAESIQMYQDFGSDTGAEIAREIISSADSPTTFEDWEAWKSGVIRGMQSAADQIAHDKFMEGVG